MKWHLSNRACFWSLVSGCASWARNPKGPQNTPFCHQVGRHPTIFDIWTGILRRILARISPGGVPPPQSQLFFDPFWTPKMGKCKFV